MSGHEDFPNSLHDGDLFNLNPDGHPLYAEFLNTHGRRGFRMTDQYGRGIFVEQSAMSRFANLLNKAVNEAAQES